MKALGFILKDNNNSNDNSNKTKFLGFTKSFRNVMLCKSSHSGIVLVTLLEGCFCFRASLT